MEYPLRATIRDHLYSFADHSRCRVVYLNLAMSNVRDCYFRINFDLIIFHTTVLGRWFRDAFWNILAPARVLKNVNARKVIMPQDEFLNSDLLVEFIHEFQIDCVFSVSPPTEWAKIYDGADFGRVAFHQVLTGYLAPKTIDAINKITTGIDTRPIDVGYRAYRAEPWLGRFGWLKRKLADEFLEHAPQVGLRVDISTEPSDTLLSMEWYRFLLNCKYTIGVEGGSSILDHNGEVKKCTEDHLVTHPEATFEQVEQACFAGRDGSLQLQVLSPRHLEACATKTCQVLVEGQYNGILKPHTHYIPLRRDFSNLEEVIELMRQDRVREQIVTNAYRDIVQSNKYTYKQFVDSVLQVALADVTPSVWSAESEASYHRAIKEDRKSWRKIKYISAIGKHVPMRIRRMGGVAAWLRKIYFSLR
jgi:hypothetical protein